MAKGGGERRELPSCAIVCAQRVHSVSSRRTGEVDEDEEAREWKAGKREGELAKSASRFHSRPACSP